MSGRYDDAVVGAGILGLAHAYALAKRGRRVVVFERGPKAQGASIRNFGMLWPIGQPPGERYELARASLRIWQAILRESGIWSDPVGSLHLAYHDDELQVLREFIESAAPQGVECALLSPAQLAERSRSVRQAGLKGALWSPTETCVDPREAVGSLPGWLNRNFGVEFCFGTAVVGYEDGKVRAGGRDWEASHLTVCSGDDLTTLYPGIMQRFGLMRCKLQMMRTAPRAANDRIGPMLAAGSTLRHYKSFQDCPTLPSLKARFSAEHPDFDRYGIHVMASQNGHGELVLGDSHEYDADIEPFDRDEIDRLILDYLAGFLDVPDLQVASRWHGIYAKHPTDLYCAAEPGPDVSILTGIGGNGMTLSFGVAETHVSLRLGDS